MTETASSRYFELHDHYGLTPTHSRDPETGEETENPDAGQLDPIQEVGVNVAIPTMVDGEVVPLATTLVIKPSEVLSDDLHARVIPGTRIVEVGPTGLLACDALLSGGQYREIDPPASERPHRAHARPEPDPAPTPDEPVSTGSEE